MPPKKKKRNEEIAEYTPHEIETYHPEIISPWLGVWPFLDAQGRLDPNQDWATYQWDNLDEMIRGKFFLSFASKICEECPTPQISNCNPPCLPVAVKSPVVSKDRKSCEILSNFQICIGKCERGERGLTINAVACGCLHSPASDKYCCSFSEKIQDSLVTYNSSNYDVYSHAFNKPYVYLIIPRYAEILKQFLKWLTQKYPSLEIYQPYSMFKNKHPEFQKIRFDVLMTFRLMLRKVFLEETGLSDSQSYDEYPPVCR